MKIVSIDTLRLNEFPNLMWVRLQTDADITGLGETYFGASAVEADIHDRLAPLLLGKSVFQIEQLNLAMQPYTGFASSGAEVKAISAIDIALWDIVAKSVQLPLCDVLGGRCKESIPVYNTCAGPNYVAKTAAVRPDNFGTSDLGNQYEDLSAFINRPAELATELMDAGIYSMKIWPFDFASGAKSGIDISQEDLATALKPFELIRAKHGDRIQLKAELHGLWSYQAAKKIIQALNPLDIDWIEDPMRMDRFDELAKLEQFTDTTLAGGETLAGLTQFSGLLHSANITVPIVDVSWVGGISVARKVAALAEAQAKIIAFHDCSGPVTLAASTHLALNLPNVREQEIARAFYYTWYPQLIDELPPIKNGHITVTERPGLGVELRSGLETRPDATYRVSQ